MDGVDWLEALSYGAAVAVALTGLRPVMRLVDRLTTTQVDAPDTGDGGESDDWPWLAIPDHVRAAQDRLDRAWAVHVHATEHVPQDWLGGFLMVIGADGATYSGVEECRFCGVDYLREQFDIEHTYRDQAATRRHRHETERHEDRDDWRCERMILRNAAGAPVVDNQLCRYCAGGFETRLIDDASSIIEVSGSPNMGHSSAKTLLPVAISTSMPGPIVREIEQIEAEAERLRPHQEGRLRQSSAPDLSWIKTTDQRRRRR